MIEVKVIVVDLVVLELISYVSICIIVNVCCILIVLVIGLMIFVFIYFVLLWVIFVLLSVGGM